ncbi:FKBP-type peptidyl-prolyl cis-trans isomerase [Desulfosediminicola ganghwensis]|uniref:FKBP-type peptidyl-prolyl cis-trans isomerase n=1 Tax=Desulfosediminicola ganghwensis TaxID=2569540 RepID=UPI0010AC819D|nr:peptidylprolyl isomerase [Desulfosediminicola ganghwensis]
MSQPKSGDTVTVHYTGKFDDGTIFDSSYDGDPIVFTIGDNDLIEGFEEGVLDMQVGDKKTVILPPEKAYGDRTDELVIEFPITEMPEDLELTVGDELELTDEDDHAILVVVTELKEDSVVVDGNAPLAGQTLTFDLELVTIG